MTHSPAVVSRRGGKGLYKTSPAGLRKSGTKSKPKKLPEYLEPDEVGALMEFAPTVQARLCMMLQWRAGLRVSEAISITRADIHLKASPPELKVRQGKGSKDRIVPIQAELAQSLSTVLGMWKLETGKPLIGVTRQMAWKWYKQALARCYELGAIPQGKQCGTHTLRHSAARYWLMNEVPINVVSRWLGHSNLQSTLIYLKLVSDPGGYMERIP